MRFITYKQINSQIYIQRDENESEEIDETGRCDF